MGMCNVTELSQAISRDGKALMKIVISKSASKTERYSAGELRSYLERITMSPFELEETSDIPCETPHFAIGSAAETLFPFEDDLGEDGFYLRTCGNNLAIVGGKRGIIYGVYELLEKLGCRFFTKTCEKVPLIRNLDLPMLDNRQVPVLELRDHNYSDIRKNPVFGTKLRINGSCETNDPERLGGCMKYAAFVHTFEKLIPTEIYGESHPEYFSLDDKGKRNITPFRTQLCLSNPDMLELIIENTRKLLLQNPDARIMSISQNDWGGSCQCPECLATDKEEGGPTGTLIRFVNKVAQILEKEFPHIIFDTLAYQYTRPIPLKARPRHNVCVRLCSIECCFSHSFEKCDEDRGIELKNGERTSFINDLHNWGSLHDRVYIWDYTTSFSHYPAPHPNWRTLQPNMQAFIKNNVKGVFEQANGAAKGGCDLNELRAYVIAKLLWDADTDVKRHIVEFTDYYYGAAAPFIRDYIDLICDKAEKDNIHIGFNDPCDSPLFCDEMLDAMDSLLNSAKKAVEAQPLQLHRTAKIQLSTRYLRLKRSSMLKNKLDPSELADFMNDWKEFGMSRMEEWVSPETSLRGFLCHKWRGVEFYEYWAEEPGEE